MEAYLAYFTTLIYHKVLINNKTEQVTEQDTTYRYDQRSRMPTPVGYGEDDDGDDDAYDDDDNSDKDELHITIK